MSKPVKITAAMKKRIIYGLLKDFFDARHETTHQWAQLPRVEKELAAAKKIYEIHKDRPAQVKQSINDSKRLVAELRAQLIELGVEPKDLADDEILYDPKYTIDDIRYES